MLAGQRFFGPRWFVPTVLLPQVYRYHRELPGARDARATEAGDERGVVAGGGTTRAGGDARERGTCVICMSVIEIDADAAQRSSDTVR